MEKKSKYHGHALAKAFAGHFLRHAADGPKTANHMQLYDNPMTDYVNGIIAQVKSGVDAYDYQLTDIATLYYYRRKALEPWWDGGRELDITEAQQQLSLL